MPGALQRELDAKVRGCARRSQHPQLDDDRSTHFRVAGTLSSTRPRSQMLSRAARRVLARSPALSVAQPARLAFRRTMAGAGAPMRGMTPPVSAASVGSRTESDTMGKIEVPNDVYWGAQTQRSLENFKIGGPAARMPIEIIRGAFPSQGGRRRRLGRISAERAQILLIPRLLPLRPCIRSLRHPQEGRREGQHGVRHHAQGDR